MGLSISEVAGDRSCCWSGGGCRSTIRGIGAVINRVWANSRGSPNCSTRNSKTVGISTLPSSAAVQDARRQITLVYVDFVFMDVVSSGATVSVRRFRRHSSKMSPRGDSRNDRLWNSRGLGIADQLSAAGAAVVVADRFELHLWLFL